MFLFLSQCNCPQFSSPVKWQHMCWDVNPITAANATENVTLGPQLGLNTNSIKWLHIIADLGWQVQVQNNWISPHKRCSKRGLHYPTQEKWFQSSTFSVQSAPQWSSIPMTIGPERQICSSFKANLKKWSFYYPALSALHFSAVTCLSVRKWLVGPHLPMSHL